ncbi:MAG: hypothetical protein IT558_05870 [Alphaproteobacteria bacterium]|nr:hypothetical protein [Alphaproteobacteria bacterium]
MSYVPSQTGEFLTDGGKPIIRLADAFYLASAQPLFDFRGNIWEEDQFLRALPRFRAFQAVRITKGIYVANVEVFSRQYSDQEDFRSCITREEMYLPPGSLLLKPVTRWPRIEGFFPARWTALTPRQECLQNLIRMEYNVKSRRFIAEDSVSSCCDYSVMKGMVERWGDLHQKQAHLRDINARQDLVPDF